MRLFAVSALFSASIAVELKAIKNDLSLAQSVAHQMVPALSQVVAKEDDMTWDDEGDMNWDDEIDMNWDDDQDWNDDGEDWGDDDQDWGDDED